MRADMSGSGKKRFALAAATCAVALLAGCGSAQEPASSPTPASSPRTPAASPSAASPPASTQPAAEVWRLLPSAPVSTGFGSVVSVWTGSQMLIRGVIWTTTTPKAVTLSYTPATGKWRTLAPGPAPQTVQGSDNAVWTGSEMLVFGPGGTSAYHPATGTWSPVTPNLFGLLGSVRVWTGHQEIFWGGGCCGDATADGVAYTPADGTWRALPPAPLTARYASGVWTGTEVIIAGGFSPAVEPMGTFADAAAYNPATRTWRKLPPMPEPRSGATAVWDGTEALFIGGTLTGADSPSATAVAFSPATGHWRRLPAMEFGRSAFAAVWTGHQVLIWGGLTGSFTDRKIPPHGAAYDPAANRWSALPMAPLRGRGAPVAVWTGHQMIVWGGTIPGARNDTPASDGAAYQPRQP